MIAFGYHQTVQLAITARSSKTGIMKTMKKSMLAEMKPLKREEMKQLLGGLVGPKDPNVVCYGECGAGAGVCKTGCSCRNWYCS